MRISADEAMVNRWTYFPVVFPLKFLETSANEASPSVRDFSAPHINYGTTTSTGLQLFIYLFYLFRFLRTLTTSGCLYSSVGRTVWGFWVGMMCYLSVISWLLVGYGVLFSRDFINSLGQGGWRYASVLHLLFWHSTAVVNYSWEV